MQFTRDADSNGTSLQGYVTVPFSKLVAIFGEPGESDGYKVAFEWDLKFADGTVATVYDWKRTNLYDGDLPEPAELRSTDWSEWNIGGRSKRAVELVQAAIAGAQS